MAWTWDDLTPEGTHKCPVCGKYDMDGIGDYDVCEVCHWEDDPVQLTQPDYTGGANPESLNQAIRAYQEGKPLDWYSPYRNGKEPSAYAPRKD